MCFLDAPAIYIPLKTLAEIFATENMWQIINSAISGESVKEDLVRLYELGKLGDNGRYVLQVIEEKKFGFCIKKVD